MFPSRIPSLISAIYCVLAVALLVSGVVVRPDVQRVSTAPPRASAPSTTVPPSPPPTVGTESVTAAPPVVYVTTTAPRPPKAIVAPVSATGDEVWDRLANCESGGNWSDNTGNGYYGGLQFTVGTWHSVGGTARPDQNTRDEQILRGKMLQARSGWGQWPACSRKLGLR